MTMMHQYLSYRGQLKGLVTAGSQAAFITVHDENQATSLYRLDASDERVVMTAEALPCGATALVSDGTTLWFAGQDGAIYESPLAKGKPKAWPKADFSQDKVAALALLSADRMAVLQSKQLSIVDRNKQSVLQQFNLTDSARTLGSNPQGDWLVLGDSKGKVSVYHADGPADFVLSSEAQVHQGSVTAIYFEAHELRFYSAGADKKLFSTHAQGALQPLDKGRSSNHDQTINSILLGKERFFTASSDKTLKSWAYAGGQPVTFKDCNAKLTDIAPILYRDKPCLLAVGTDASIRIVGLTEDEKFTELKWQLNDGYQLGSLWLSRDNPTEREQGLKLLAGFDDRKALDLLAGHFSSESDRALRDQMVTLLSGATHAHSTVLLENLLANKQHESVRKLAFEGLVKRAAVGDLNPYEKALATGFADTAEPALELLAKLAKKESRAVMLMVGALQQHPQQRVRLLALSLLEGVYEKTSPKASLQALQSRHADLQRAALIRLFQRKLLDDINVKRAILQAQDHADAQLRHTAFLVSVLSRTTLAQALKTREPGLARQLQELEDFELLAEPEAQQKGQKKTEADSAAGGLVSTLKKMAERVSGKGADKMPPPSSLAKLTHDDYTVLLQGMTNRYADICFMSAFSLSVLEDQRAFGLLLLLSQEKDASIRSGVCRAFGWLKQTDGIPTLELMLNDDEAGVRDAAFTALHQLQPEPALIAERGFAAKHEDIHARALKALLDIFSGKLAEAGKTEALGLLTEALNDPFEAIRKETFKACLNRKLGGSEEETLRLLLASRFENIHLEVLNELMAKAGVVSVPAWVEPLLFELFNDNFEAVRKAAFNFAIAEKKRFERQAVLGAAVSSEFPDTRELVFRQIQKRPTQAEQVHLQKLLDDKDDALRNQALSVIIDSKNNVGLLHKALESLHDDIRVNAAQALARTGDERVYAVLEALTNREQPEKPQDLAHWLKITRSALDGLGLLGDPRGFAIALRFLADKNEDLVQQAAYILPWVSDKSHLPELNKLMTDERDQVRIMAALSLALSGEKSGHLVLAQQDQVKVNTYVDVGDQLAATLCQPEVTITSLQPFLTNGRWRFTGLLVLAAHEVLLHAEEPVLITRALSIAEPSVQLFSADLMVRFSEPEQCWEYLRSWLAQPHRHKDDDKWDISTDTLKQMAAVLVHGDGHVKAHLLRVMNYLENLAAKKTWELHYQAFCERYAAQITRAEAQVAEPEAAKPAQDEWNQRAFGAYLGLVRQQYSRADSDSYPLQGLHSLSALAARDEAMRGSVNSCLLTLLNHQHVDIRQLAFDQLKDSGFDAALLGNTAITSPQSDIATQGLELLTQHYPLKQSRSLLEGLISSDNAILSQAAYQIYRDENGLLNTAEFALRSDTLWLRTQCVSELNRQYENKDAQQWLLKAAVNDHTDTANQAGLFLAQHRHPQTLGLLKKRLDHETDDSVQNYIIHSLRQLPKVEVAEYLLDYVLHNKLNRQPAERMYRHIADYRHAGLFPGLLKSLEMRPKESRFIMRTLLVTTGYDQHIDDYDKEQADQSWLEKQYPRHDALLIQYFNTLIRLDHHADAAALKQSMSWVKDKSADAALADAIPVIAEKHLSDIIEAIVYRVERREGDTAGLLRVLDHKDSAVQFIAAEGLANNGHAQGFNVLFAAVDYQENSDYRERAVLALGKLGDQRALDKLLKLAEDREHALNEVAVEAIGHLSESEHAEKIFKLLKTSLAKAGSYSDMNKHALNGLRWFGSLEAWQLIGSYTSVSDDDGYRDWELRRHAAELLRYRDTEGNRDLLLKVLRTDDDSDVVMTAYESARLLWNVGDEQCSEVDYALIQGFCPEVDDKALERIVKYAPTADLLMLLGADYALDDEDGLAELLRQLGDSLLKRDDCSAAELSKALQSENAVVVSIVARLLIRMKSLTKPVQQGLQATIERFYQRWQAQRLQFKKEQDWKGELERTQQVVQQLLWSGVQQGVESPVVTQLLNTQDKQERVFQLHILNALLARDGLYDTTMVGQLTALLQSPVHKVSELACQLLARDGDKTALNWENFLSQPEQLLGEQFTSALQTAAADSAHQAQALPVLISQGDTATLHAIAADAKQQESLRVGAIEGLARILTDAAGHALSDVHKNSADKDVAKAAYRALRRQQRGQQRSLPAKQSAAVTVGQGA